MISVKGILIHCYLQIDNFIFAEKKIHLAQLRESAAGWVFLSDHLVFPFFLARRVALVAARSKKKQARQMHDFLVTAEKSHHMNLDSLGL